ncbi:hypothetical protein AJ80_05570 [Polytolypa hystricis UAMH7299]|uniref:Aminotransferase class I/classII large domain-containing protein n=1 Tax=Polytolypa hystricis (strain UAMH7299) TaxID=1447883 RepID=A0A2B7Y1Q9_POLH7|nr:hypothetical protein AJ80_05570 [Polytolypa hystricis UAMH7299]
MTHDHEDSSGKINGHQGPAQVGKRPMIGLSKRSSEVVESIMPKISAAVAERTKRDNPNIDLSTAENWLLRQELMELFKDGLNQEFGSRHFSYPNGFSGDPDLVEALSKFFNEYFAPHVPVESSHIATAPGAASCLDALLHTICDPGDGVLVPGPYWNGFDFQFRVRASVKPVLVNTSSFMTTLSMDLLPALKDAFEKADFPIRALVLTNPHNPFAQCYPREVLEACLRFCEEHNIHYISDEVYALSVFKSSAQSELPPFTSALSLDPKSAGFSAGRIHVIWSISKDFGSSGIRLGCTVSQTNPEVIVGATLASNTQTSSLAAIFTKRLLTSPQLSSLVARNQERLSSSHSTITSWLRLNDFEYIPANAGVYVFAKLCKNAASWDDEAEMVQRCKQAGVVVSAGRSYHGVESEKGWARITFAVERDTLWMGLERLAKALGVKPPAT